MDLLFITEGEELPIIYMYMSRIRDINEGYQVKIAFVLCNDVPYDKRFLNVYQRL